MTTPDGPDRSLADLAELHQAGALTHEGFTAARAAVLGQAPATGQAPPAGGVPTQPIPADPGHRPAAPPPAVIPAFDVPPPPPTSSPARTAAPPG